MTTAVWPERRLGDLATMGSGGTPPSKVLKYYGGGIPWVSITDMTASSKYVRRTAKTLSKDGLAASAARLFEPNVILYAMYASLGECALAVGPVSSSQAILGIKPGPDLDREYLYYYLESIKARIKAAGQQGTQSNLNATMVRDLRIPLPPLVEQRRIAEALAEADDLIASLDILIVKKQRMMQGMLQQLLTGSSRLCGFSAPWVESRVGRLLEFKNGLNKSSEYFGAGTPILNFMDVMNGPIITAADIVGRVTLTRDEIRRFSAKRGDLFFTRTSETVDEVGTAAVLVDDIPDACFSGFVLRGRLRTRDVDSRFLSRIFQLGSVRAQITSSATYTTRALTNGRSLGRVVIEHPPLDEQRAIASVLDDGDAELGVLGARLAKAQAVKTGMMQQLLTGRLRLPEEDAS